MKYNFRKKVLFQSCSVAHIPFLAARLPFGLLYLSVYLVSTHRGRRPGINQSIPQMFQID